MTTDGAHTSCVTRALVLGAKFYHILEGTAPRTPNTCHNEAMWMVCGGVQGPPGCSYQHLPFWCFYGGAIIFEDTSCSSINHTSMPGGTM